MNTNITTQKRPLRVVFFGVLIIVALLTVYNLWEWHAVEKLNQLEEYNFEDVTDRAYYYQSKTLYAFIHLFWGICFGGSLIILISNFLFKTRWYKIVSLMFPLIVIGVYLYHFTIA